MGAVITRYGNVTVAFDMAQPFETAVVVPTVGDLDNAYPWLAEDEIRKAGTVGGHDDPRSLEYSDLVFPKHCLRIQDGESRFR